MSVCPWDARCVAAPAQLMLLTAFQYKVVKILVLLFKGKEMDAMFLICIAHCVSKRSFRKRPATEIFPVSSSASQGNAAGSLLDVIYAGSHVGFQHVMHRVKTIKETSDLVRKGSKLYRLNCIYTADFSIWVTASFRNL